MVRAMNSKERCLAAIAGRPVDRAPVFPLLMFFAAQRLGVPYRQYATNGHALAEAQLKVLDTFPIDAVTCCSDAFRLSADLGGEMVYPEDRTPFLARPLVRCEADLERLRKPDGDGGSSRVADRVRATREMAQAVGQVAMVVGWVDMPLAEACSLCGVSEFMMVMLEQPLLAHRLLAFLTDVVIDFALRQLEAGAPIIGAGDAAASLISSQMYREFAMPYEQEVCGAIHAAGGMVKLHICGKTTHLLGDMVYSCADVFNVDHLVSLSVARHAYERVGKCFKGNLDPVGQMLHASPEQCQAAAVDCLRIVRGCRYMLSAGCEVPAAVSDEVFRAFCEASAQAAG